MILKFLHKNIARLNYSSLVRNSAFLFSQDDGNKKGFDKFKRKNSPQNNQSQQPAKSPQKEIPKQKNTQDQARGFSNFKRKANNQRTQGTSNTNVNESENNQQKPGIGMANNKTNSSEQKENKPMEKEQKRKQANPESSLKGFAKFKRSTDMQAQIYKEESKQPAEKNTQQQTQQPSHQEQPKNAHQEANEQQSTGFKKFQIGGIKIEVRLKNNQSQNKKKDNQKKQQQPPNNNQQAQKKVQSPVPNEQKQQHQQPKRGFSSFKKRSLRPRAQRKQKVEQKQQKKSENPSQQVQKPKQAEATSYMKQKSYKSLQQIQKQEIELELKNKEEFFKRKVEQYKKKKAQQQQPTFLSSLLEIKKRLQRQFQQRTGIDINAYQQPPQWIKNNPALLPLWVRWKYILLGILLYLYFTNHTESAEQITSEQFIRHIDSGQASVVTFKENEHDVEMETGKKHDSDVLVRLKTGEVYMTKSNSDFENLVLRKVNILNSINPTNQIVIMHSRNQNFNLVTTVRFILSMVLIYMFFSSLAGATRNASKGARGRGQELFTQSKSKRFMQKVNVKFADVVGMQKSKQEIVQFIDFLVNPEKYHRLGAKIPRGALLTGPPGTGKTMIAKACAGESNVPFFTISGSQFIEMYVGVGAQRVRDLFKQAKEAAPSIIFIDQIDAVGKKRSSGMGGNDEKDNTLNQLLVEMDGFESNANVIVFAATNQKEVLDPALTRPGRFDRLIEVDLPDIQGRKEIFMVHLKPIVIDSQSSMEDYARRMATLTPGFSGADIKNLCNQAAIMAARNGNKFVTVHDFELATERVIAGVQKKSHLITEQTRRIVAYHECGHGTASWFLQGANPLLKITIIPRSKGSLGFAQYLPHETQISNRKQLQDQICVILAGRVAEQVFFNKISTGAYDDLQKAYKIAKMIVTQYGMDQKLGWLTYEQSQYAKYYSKHTQELIDQQIMKIIKDCTQRTRTLIESKREVIDKLAHKLLEVETIDLTQIAEVLGERPFKPNKQYEEYLNEKKKMMEEVGKDKSNPDNTGEGGAKQDPIAAMTSKFKNIKRTDYLL